MTFPAAAFLVLFAGAAIAAPARGAVDEIREAVPVYKGIADTVIRVPSRSVDLGSSEKMYRCWRLRLTGDHGKQSLGVMERLRSVQKAVKEQNAELEKDLLLREGAPAPDPKLDERLRKRHASLRTLVTTYRKLIRLGQKNGLLKTADKEMFSGRRSVSPILKNDDYTMVYDEASPGCARPSP